MQKAGEHRQKIRHSHVVPLAIETMGTAGIELQELSRVLKRSFETTILPKDDSSAASDFNSTWVYRLSTTIQRGTADIIYNVAQSTRAPLSTMRIAKDGQIVETITRDRTSEKGSQKCTTTKTTATTKSKQHQGGTTTLNTKSTACRRSCRITSTRNGNVGCSR